MQCPWHLGLGPELHCPELTTVESRRRHLELQEKGQKMAQIIHLRLEGDAAFSDLADKTERVIHLTGSFTIAALEAGMTSGRPSLALRIDLPDGRVVIQETSVRLFLSAADAIRARFGGV